MKAVKSVFTTHFLFLNSFFFEEIISNEITDTAIRMNKSNSYDTKVWCGKVRLNLTHWFIGY